MNVEEKLKIIYKEYRDLMLHYAKYATRSRDNFMTEDVIEMIKIRIWKNIDFIDDAEVLHINENNNRYKIHGWVTLQSIYALDQYSRKKNYKLRKNCSSIDSNISNDFDNITIADTLKSKEEEPDWSITQELFDKKMANIFTDDELFVISCKVDGYSHQEIADALGISLNQFAYQYTKLKKKIISSIKN